MFIQKLKAVLILIRLLGIYIYDHWNKKSTVISASLIVVLLGFYLYSNWGMLGPKPTELYVSSSSTLPKINLILRKVKITNKKDIRKLYRILVHAPRMSKKPINCPSDGAINYKLSFHTKRTSRVITVDPYGCEEVTIGTKIHKTFMNDKRAKTFWNLLAKNLNIDADKLR